MKRICLSKCPVFFKKSFFKKSMWLQKSYNTEQCLSAPLKKSKTSVHGGIAFAALLTDLSEAFDYLDHEFIIAKLDSYGFIWLDFKSVHRYLSDRKQTTKINSSHNSWLAIMFGVHQRSLPGPLLNNVFFRRFIFYV